MTTTTQAGTTNGFTESHCTDTLTQYRLNMIESTLKTVSENLVTLAQLEQKHLETKESLARAFNSMSDLNSRMREVEAELPTLKLIRGWVIAGVISIVSMLGVAIFKMFSITIQ